MLKTYLSPEPQAQVPRLNLIANQKLPSLTRILALITLILIGGIGGCRTKSNGQIKAHGSRIGGLKNLSIIEASLNDRIYAPSQPLQINDKISKESGEELRALIGEYNGPEGNKKLTNASPNAVNMMLLQVIANGIADDISAQSDWNKNFEPHFQKTLTDLLQETASKEERNKSLQEFWLSIVSSDQGSEDLKAWLLFVNDPQNGFTPLESPNDLRALFKSIFLDPYYLIEQ